MAEHIHWKQTTNRTYLGAWDFEQGKDMIVQIKDVVKEIVQGPRGRDELYVLYFEGGVKPMILNNKNKENIAKATKHDFYDEWVGKKIQLYVTQVIAFGETTDAIRVREFAPR